MKPKHTIPLILIASGLMISACNSGNSNGQPSSVTAHQAVKPDAVSNHGLKHVSKQEGYLIGKGYSEYLGSIAELVCYNATAHQGATSGSLMLRASYGAVSFEKYTSDLLKVSYKSGDSNPFVTLDGLLEYAREQKSDDLSTSMYITSISNRTVEVTPDKKPDYVADSDEYASLWNERGREQLKYLKEGRISPEQFSKLCGDHTVSSYDEYAAFVIKLTYKFKSKEDNMKFREEINGKYATVSVKQAHEVEQKMQQFGGELSVEGRQWGGDPTQLPQATSSISGQTTCDPKNTYACDQLMSTLLQYGSTFSNQFSANNPNSNNEQERNMQLTGKFVIGPSFYELSGGQGVGESYSAISPEIIKSRVQLTRDLELVNNANRIFDDLMTNPQAKLSMQGLRPNPYYDLVAVWNPSLEKNIKILDDELQYMELYYKKLQKLYKQFNSGEIQSNGKTYHAVECWTIPDSCQKVAAAYHKLIKNFRLYIVELKTTSHAADSFKRELAIVDLDDDREYGSDLHYIRLFNLTHGPQYGIYLGKIPYLEQSSDIFDNVGYSLAAGYASEPTNTYNNGYFYAGIRDIELNKLTPDEYSKDFPVDGCSYTPDKPGSFYKVGKFENSIYSYCKNNGFGGDGGSGAVTTECNEAYEAYKKEYFSKGLLQCIPYDFRPRTDKNLLSYYNSRLIISTYNNPLRYSGRNSEDTEVGQIKSHSGYEARLSDLSLSAFQQLNAMLDPAALATIYVSHLLRDDGKIYHTDRLYYLRPYDSIALKEFDCNKLDSVEKAACLVSQATANNSKGTPTLRLAYSQYAAYHQGIELPKFMLEYSLLGEHGDYDADYANEKTNEFGY